MYINQEKCAGCEKCVPYCPRDATRTEQRKAAVDLDTCVECGACLKNAGRPRDAVYNIRLGMPRAYWKAFSDPFGKHGNTALKHAGRGTERVKTNDVTSVVHSLDMTTFAMELGHPGIGSTLRDLQTILQAVTPYAETFEVNSPVTSLITDREKGLLDPSVLGGSIVSAVVGFSCRLDHATSVPRALKEVSQHIDMVFSLYIIYRADERDDSPPVMNTIRELSLGLHTASIRTNLGLGRSRCEDRIEEGGAAL